MSTGQQSNFLRHFAGTHVVVASLVEDIRQDYENKYVLMLGIELFITIFLFDRCIGLIGSDIVQHEFDSSIDSYDRSSSFFHSLFSNYLPFLSFIIECGTTFQIN